MVEARGVAAYRGAVVTRDALWGDVGAGRVEGSTWAFVELWFVVACLSLSLAKTGGGLVGGHGVPIVRCVVLLPIACGAGAEEIGGNVYHGGGCGGCCCGCCYGDGFTAR